MALLHPYSDGPPAPSRQPNAPRKDDKMQKRFLITPGPTPVPPEVLSALAEPVIHHRAPRLSLIHI